MAALSPATEGSANHINKEDFPRTRQRQGFTTRLECHWHLFAIKIRRELLWDGDITTIIQQRVCIVSYIVKYDATVARHENRNSELHAIVSKSCGGFNHIGDVLLLVHAQHFHRVMVAPR